SSRTHATTIRGHNGDWLPVFEVPVPVMKPSLRPLQEMRTGSLTTGSLDVDRRLQGDRCRRALCRGRAGAETTPARVPRAEDPLAQQPGSLAESRARGLAEEESV